MQKYSIFFFAFVLNIVLFSPQKTRAAFASGQDIPYVTESLSIRYHLKKDGSYRTHVYGKYKVMTDEGRNRVGSLSLQFNSFTEKAKILTAKTVNGAKSFHVDKKNIVSKELRDHQVIGFDAVKSMIATFPNVGVGSVIHFEYEILSSESPYKDSWSTLLTLNNAVVQNVLYEINSEVPVHYQFVGEEGAFVSEEKVPGRHIRFTNTKPINTLLVNEQSLSLHPSRLPGVQISTVKDWDQFGLSMIKDYDRLLKAPLPASLQKLLDDTTGITDPTARLNPLLAALSKRIRYFGDWKRRRGGFIPRSLGEIAKTEYADCKEISLVLAALLRKIGFTADVALVQRGYLPAIYMKPYEMANSSLFNHAIVRAEKDGKVYWLDGTNLIAFAQGIPMDIEDRPAFVLNKNGGRLERTRAILPSDNNYVREQVIQIEENNEISLTGKYFAQGNGAYSLLMNESENSRQVNEWNFIKSLVVFDELISFKLDDYPDAKSQTVDQSRTYSTRVRSFIFTTNEGPGLPIYSRRAMDSIVSRMPYQKGDMQLRGKIQEDSKVIYKNIRAENLNKFSCKIQSPWIDLERDASAKSGDVILSDKLTIKKDVIFNSEVETPAFKKLQDEVASCFSRRFLIFR